MKSIVLITLNVNIKNRKSRSVFSKVLVQEFQLIADPFGYDFHKTLSRKVVFKIKRYEKITFCIYNPSNS